MQCSICHETGHNASVCYSYKINHNYQKANNMFMRVMEYVDFHCQSSHPNYREFSNKVRHLSKEWNIITKGWTKPLWRRLNPRLLLTIEIDLPFFARFKSQLNDNLKYLFIKMEHNNKYIRRASYKHFYIALLKNICYFYYTIRFNNNSVALSSNSASPMNISETINRPSTPPITIAYSPPVLLRQYPSIHTPHDNFPIRMLHRSPAALFGETSPHVSRNYIRPFLRRTHGISNSFDNLSITIPNSMMERNELSHSIFESQLTMEAETQVRNERERLEVISRVKFYMDPPETKYHNDSCSVCFDSLVSNTTVALDCRHAYCLDCLTGVITHSKCLCPMCRNPIHTVHFKSSISPMDFNKLVSSIYL